jgi:inosine-uridine nucleoside N-ribohydrolase
MKRMKKTKLFLIILFLFSTILNAQVRNVIIDADTDNEVDDLYAIAAALRSDKLEVIGLTAAQWFGRQHAEGEGNHFRGWLNNSAYTSWLLNIIILQMMDREEIPALRGNENRILYKKGGLNNKPQESEASDFIIKKALELPENEKLTIISTGSLTNVASAIMSRPEIAKKISLHWLGQTYDFDKNLWTGERETNIANDLDAFDVICDATDLELHIMPSNLSGLLRFHNKRSIARLEGKKGIDAFMRERWRTYSNNNPHVTWWAMYDVALIYALTNPGWAREKMVDTPPGTTSRKVSLYTNIKLKKMKKEFSNSFLK